MPEGQFYPLDVQPPLIEGHAELGTLLKIADKMRGCVLRMLRQNGCLKRVGVQEREGKIFYVNGSPEDVRAVQEFLSSPDRQAELRACLAGQASALSPQLASRVLAEPMVAHIVMPPTSDRVLRPVNEEQPSLIIGDE